MALKVTKTITVVNGSPDDAFMLWFLEPYFHDYRRSENIPRRLCFTGLKERFVVQPVRIEKQVVALGSQYIVQGHVQGYVTPDDGTLSNSHAFISGYYDPKTRKGSFQVEADGRL